MKDSLVAKKYSKTHHAGRRNFLIQTAVGGSGLILGLYLPQIASADTSVAPEMNAWIVIKPDDTVIIRMARTEMGQGTLTGLAQLVAEELDCDWSKVTTERVSPQDNLKRKNAWGQMLTVGSFGIRFSQDVVRRAGAAARLMLLQAAAQEWKVPLSELSVANSLITHTGSGRQISFGKLVDAAAKLPPPDSKGLILKKPEEWKLIGKSVKRLDTLDKLDGSKTYAVDVKLPGMLNAILIASPIFGAKLLKIDATLASSMPGVKKIAMIGDQAFTVIADTWWHAKAASEKVIPSWDEADLHLKSSSTITAYLRTGLTTKTGLFSFRDEGNAIAAIAGSVKKVEATYSAPFLAHATMEPMNCTAMVTTDRAEIWVPTQDPEGALLATSRTSGIAIEKCILHRFDPGGGFGRRGRVSDYVVYAVQIAQQMPGVPIKMIWTREEDMTHGQYRPISMCKMTAGLDANNRLMGMHVRLSGQSIYAWRNPNENLVGFKDNSQVQGWQGDPKSDQQLVYQVPNLLIEYAMRNTHVPVGTWRGVNIPQNAFYMETFIEEIARAAGQDSLEFRRSITRLPKQLAILNLAAEKAGWGKPLSKGVFRGIAQFMSYAAYSAAVVELSLNKKSGEVKVHRVVLAVDCGYAVNPGQIAAQVEGSIVYGLSAVMWGECTVERGRIKQTNFDNYRVLRLAEMPKVETYIAPTGGSVWGGIGEPTIAVVAPAVVNALSLATGKFIRDLPIKNQVMT